MKKIKSLKQLEAEKKLIKQRQAALEEKMRNSWTELKDNLKPVNIAKDALGSVLKIGVAGALNGKGMVRNALTYGVTLLANKFMNTLGNKWGNRSAKRSSTDDQMNNS